MIVLGVGVVWVIGVEFCCGGMEFAMVVAMEGICGGTLVVVEALIENGIVGWPLEMLVSLECQYMIWMSGRMEMLEKMIGGKWR